MDKVSQPKTTTTKIGLYTIGIAVFGGSFLASIIDANKYSNYDLWEFRLFLAGSAVIYYSLVFFFNRNSQEENVSPNNLKKTS